MNDQHRICLNGEVLDFMAARLDRKSFVLEYGGGWSSRWFADRCGFLLTIETSPVWAQEISADLVGSDSVWQVYQAEFPQLAFPGAGSETFADMQPDLVLVDCVEKHRMACLHCAWQNVSPGGWVILDDAQRFETYSIVKLLRAKNQTHEMRWRPGDIKTARARLAIAWQKPLP